MRYAFCNFKEHESAVECVKNLNGTELNDHTIIVQKYKSKKERSKEFETITGGSLNINLFVKNLDPVTLK